MDKLGLAPFGGGPTGARTRLRNQMRRLFGCTVSLIYEDAHMAATMNAPIARRATTRRRRSRRRLRGRALVRPRSLPTVRQAAAAIRSVHRAANLPAPTDAPAVRETLAGIARQHAANPATAPRQAAAIAYDDAIRLLALARQPRTSGRGIESATADDARGQIDAAIVALLFCAGMRRSEVADLRWQDVEPTAKPGTDRNLTARPTKTVKLPARRQARHFTQLDQVTQLVAARDADPELGFMARLLALCSLPRTNPGNRLQFKRVNGPYTLYMVAGGGNKLPYGTVPRLLLAWVCTEAVRTQSPELVLGDSLAAFMRKLGMDDRGGGVHGERTRLRNQMRRLFGCMVSLTYADARGEATMNAPIARVTEYWWSESQPDARSLWESKIELGEDFFNEVIRNPVQLDLHILKRLSRSPLGLDLYLWLTYRTFKLKRPLRLTWAQLYRQFGVDPAKANDARTVDNFRTDCLRELKKIRTAWPDLHYQTVKGALVVLPSSPRIAPSQTTPRGRLVSYSRPSA